MPKVNPSLPIIPLDFRTVSDRSKDIAEENLSHVLKTLDVGHAKRHDCHNLIEIPQPTAIFLEGLQPTHCPDQLLNHFRV
jgi:hypothetical protein